MSSAVPNEIDRVWFRRAGWRQGALIRRSSALTPIIEAIEGRGAVHGVTHWLVVTQDCDLLHKSAEKEPWCELLACREIEKPNGSFQQGKNPRQIDFPFIRDEHPAWLHASVHDRAQISRSVILNQKATPDSFCTVSSGHVRTVIGWLARRYTRSAFPDALNDRLHPTRDAIEAILREHGELVDAIYLTLNDTEELMPEQPYKVDIYVVMRDADYRESLRRDAVSEVAHGIEIAWSKCPGIEVGFSGVKSERELTLDDLRYLRRWDSLDFLSNSDEGAV